MDDNKFAEALKRALKLVNEVEDEEKQDGLHKLRDLLDTKDTRLESHGFGQVILKELLRLLQFEGGQVLCDAVDLVLIYFCSLNEKLDEISETLIYRVARSTDVEVCKICLGGIIRLIDCFDDRIALHSKQLLKLADLNDKTDLNPQLITILKKLDEKLPKRKPLEA